MRTRDHFCVHIVRYRHYTTWKIGRRKLFDAESAEVWSCSGTEAFFSVIVCSFLGSFLFTNTTE